MAHRSQGMAHLVFGAVYPDNQPVVGREVMGQPVGSAVGYNLAVVDDDNPLADGLHFRQDVRAEDDGVPPSQILNQATDFNNLLGVQAHGGLVQDQHRGISQQGLCNAPAGRFPGCAAPGAKSPFSGHT